MKKVLVTGSLGYIGTCLTRYLKEHNYYCIGYDMGFFKDCTLYPPEQTETVIQNVRNLSQKDLRNVNVLVHLAGISNDPFGNLKPEKIYDPTRDYSLKIAKMCKKMGVKFIFASSCSVYGIGQDELLTEESSTHPQTPYSLNKLQIEQDLAEISNKNFSPISLRLSTVFGVSPRMRFDTVINMFCGMALTDKKIILNSDGTSWRPNVYILDVCKAFKESIELDYNEGNLLILNVGDSASNLRVIDIAELVRRKVRDCEIHFLTDKPDLDDTGLIKDKKVMDGVDTRTYKVSFEKIKQYIKGFKCEWSVERGIDFIIEELEKLELSNSVFKDKKFYRLQHIEELHNRRLISDELLWNHRNHIVL